MCVTSLLFLYISFKGCFQSYRSLWWFTKTPRNVFALTSHFKLYIIVGQVEAIGNNIWNSLWIVCAFSIFTAKIKKAFIRAKLRFFFFFYLCSSLFNSYFKALTLLISSFSLSLNQEETKRNFVLFIFEQNKKETLYIYL